MLPTFAYAETRDLWSLEWVSILTAVGVCAAVGILVVFPITLARRRGHPHASLIFVIGVFWALLTIAAITVPVVTRWHDQANEATLLKTGYYDPRDWPPPPTYPWPIWISLGVVYLLYVAWSLLRRSPLPPNN